MKRNSCGLGLLIAFFLSMILASSSGQAASPPPESPSHGVRDEGGEYLFLAPGAPWAASPADTAAVALDPWTKLVYQSFSDRNWEIYATTDYYGSSTRLTNESASDVQPRFNRGCTRIAFSSNRTGNYELFAMNLDGTGVAQLTFETANDYNPAWSPDGGRIVFNSYRDGQSELYVMYADGTYQSRLTWDSNYDGEPAWSPDGSKIAFTSNRTGVYHIWVMNVDGSGQTQLSTQAYSEHPTWSPDGSQIAYDSDGDADGWQELWLMNADGSGQRQGYKPYESQTDVWTRSWSPDGRRVAFTRIAWVYKDESRYWTTAYLNTWDSVTWERVTLAGGDSDWYPDWQSVDPWPPVSNVAALPAQSPGPFTVSWSGLDQGPAGITSYDVQVQDGAGGAWTAWQVATTAITASYPGLGGYSYSFRSRARDQAGNLELWPSVPDASTTVEAQPPSSRIEDLPAYSRVNTAVHWGGVDPGASGIKVYDVQYRKGASGNWVDWLMGTTDTSSVLTSTLGLYYFRSRATDHAQNVEPWPAGNEDMSTTFYTWGIAGTVQNTSGLPVVGASISTQPEAFHRATSDGDGVYAAHTAVTAGTYTVTWKKAGYGALPPTVFSAEEDARLDVVLPPADNLVRNAGFESSTLDPGDWQPSSVVTPVLTGDVRHTGQHAISFGQPFTFTPPVKIPSGSVALGPQLAVDKDGTVHVVYCSDDQVYYTQRRRGESWSSPENISHDDWGAASVQMAIGEDGTVHVVWKNQLCCTPWLSYAQRSPGGLWSTSLQVAFSPSALNAWQMALDKAGRVYVVWDAISSLLYIRRDPGGSWSSSQALADYLADLTFYMMTDNTGTIHVSWAGQGGVYYRQTSDGDWSSPQNVDSYPTRSTNTQMTVSQDGSVHLVWSDPALKYARRRSDGTWSAPQKIVDNPDVSLNRVAMDRGGTLHVVFERTGGGLYTIRRLQDGTWSQLDPISPNAGRYMDVRMVMDSLGIIHLAWTGKDDQIYYTHRLYSDDWLPDQRLSNNPGSPLIAGLAADTSGHIHAMWQRTDDLVLEVDYAVSSPAEQTGDSTLAQILSIPITMSTPILSFVYQFGSTASDNSTWFDVRANNGATSTLLFSTTANTAWTHGRSNLAAWVSQTFSLTFNLHQTAGHPRAWAYLDQVTLGSALPDLYVSKGGPALALPGGQVVYTIVYGNQGDAVAHNVHITDSLPAGLVAVAVDPSPASGTLLPTWDWDIGDLPGGSGPWTIVLTSTVAPTATMCSSLTNTVGIRTTSQELEQANNLAYSATFVGRHTYLPLVLKNHWE